MGRIGGGWSGKELGLALVIRVAGAMVEDSPPLTATIASVMQARDPAWSGEPLLHGTIDAAVERGGNHLRIGVAVGRNARDLEIVAGDTRMEEKEALAGDHGRPEPVPAEAPSRAPAGRA